MSTVKDGDRVRATCGESVIVGTVATAVDKGLVIDVDGSTDVYFSFRAWTIEVIAPPIPDVVGTIVRDRDGDAWQCDGTWWRRTGSSIAYRLMEANDLSGPLTVLWTPTP